MDKRAWSREVGSRGRRCRSRSLSSYRSRLWGRERGGRSSSASRFHVVAHAVGGRGLLAATALSVEALGRVVPGLDPRIDIGHAVTALGVGGRGLLTATAPALSVRVPMPVGGCGAVVRDRPLSRIARVTARGQRAFTCFSCPLAVRGSRTTGQTWAPGGCGGLCLSASCGLEQQRASFLFWRDVFCRSPVCFLQELAKFFMGLSGSYSLGATGVLAGVTASAAASGGVACPSSPAAGAATFLCCDCDACWGWRFACCSRCWSWRFGGLPCGGGLPRGY